MSREKRIQLASFIGGYGFGMAAFGLSAAAYGPCLHAITTLGVAVFGGLVLAFGMGIAYTVR